MSLHLLSSGNHVPDQGPISLSPSGSEEEYDDDQVWDDFAEDSIAQQPCFSLFEDKKFPSATEAMANDRSKHDFDLDDTCTRLAFNSHQRIRLINYIRKNKPSPSDVSLFTGKEAFFSSDEYLLPAVADDPLLQFQPDDGWSESESDDESASKNIFTDLPSATRRISVLEKRLSDAKQDMVDYQAFVRERLNLSLLTEASDDSSNRSTPRDDDSHYFESYGENDIHATMIQDKVRTSTYAQFIMTNPALFRDAIVLDVGCGTGILSLFAAKSGAKRVIAVDASDIAERAAKIVKANGLDEVITVIRGKIEEITLPDAITHVDIIISEWMGYALLYESMLDSVLRARDLFLRTGGVMAPSQCKMMLALCEGSEIFKDRVGFWHDVYGFDLSSMADALYDEAIVDVVGSDTVVSEPYVLKDLLLKDTIPRQLDFSSSFTLVSNVNRRTKIHSLVLFFDVFFTTTGEPVPSETEVKIVKEGDIAIAEIWPVGGKAAPQRRASQGGGLQGQGKMKVTSFSTGPKSVPTHWKQTVFMLREPITVDEGNIVAGMFHCRKSETNSRELDVEIHYWVRENEGASSSGDVVVQIYRVR